MVSLAFIPVPAGKIGEVVRVLIIFSSLEVLSDRVDLSMVSIAFCHSWNVEEVSELVEELVGSSIVCAEMESLVVVLDADITEGLMEDPEVPEKLSIGPSDVSSDVTETVSEVPSGSDGESDEAEEAVGTAAADESNETAGTETPEARL